MKVEMRGLTKHFGSTVAVEDFTVTLEDGHLTSILGPSGCGKSTVLNLLAGIVPATRGEILFDGEAVTGLPPELRGIGLVFQNYSLYPHMTVLGNISFPLEIKKVPRAQREESARAMAALVHVDNLLHRKPRELSGGQQQRVAIARALVKKPNLLLLDEPLSNLDARLRLEMREEIRRIQQETRVTTVFVTHDQEEAMSISDRIVLMNAGRLQQEDEPQRLYHEPRNQFVADFLGTPPINHLPGHMKGGAFILEGGQARFPFSRGAGAPEGRPLILAVRAESAHVPDPDEGALFSASVESIYAMGKEVLGYFDIGGHSFRCYLDGDMLPRPGTEIPIAFRERGTFLFDGETGDRLL